VRYESGLLSRCNRTFAATGTICRTFLVVDDDPMVCMAIEVYRGAT